MYKCTCYRKMLSLCLFCLLVKFQMILLFLALYITPWITFIQVNVATFKQDILGFIHNL